MSKNIIFGIKTKKPFLYSTSERFAALKPGLIHHFLHLEIPIPTQEYDSCCMFDVFYHLSLPFD